MEVKDSKYIKNKEKIKDLALFIEGVAEQVTYLRIHCEKFNEL